jgi:hypothetical protein
MSHASHSQVTFDRRYGAGSDVGVVRSKVTDRRRRDDGETSLWQPSAPGSERCWRPVMGAMVFNSSRRRSGLWSVVERRPSAA